MKDNTIGLIGEVKINAGTVTPTNIHHKDNAYRWGGLTAIGREHSARQGTYDDD